MYGIRKLRAFPAAIAGATAIEFAILCPLYLLLLMGMMAYGIYFGASHSVQQISADTARAAVAGVNAADREALANGFVARNAGQYLLIDPRKLTVEVGDSVADASQFDVIVSYDASELPIWNLFYGIAMPSKTIERHSTIRIGGI